MHTGTHSNTHLFKTILFSLNILPFPYEIKLCLTVKLTRIRKADFIEIIKCGYEYVKPCTYILIKRLIIVVNLENMYKLQCYWVVISII